jgi:hypothetical protein
MSAKIGRHSLRLAPLLITLTLGLIVSSFNVNVAFIDLLSLLSHRQASR